MAFIQCDFFSNALGMCTSINVILPEPKADQIAKSDLPAGQRYPVLWLLHGHSDDHTIWMRRTNIERYVADMNLAVVMPAVDRSFYCDMAHGLKYWTYISEELPRIVRALFPISAAREDNFAAGLSMGGYGAFKLGLNLPERYAAAASLSGALRKDWQPDPGADPAWAGFIADIFGDFKQYSGSVNDLYFQAGQLAQSKAPRTKLFACCGAEDFLHKENLAFRDHARRLGLDYTYEEGPGTHEWGYWDAMIQKVLKWLPLK